MATNAVSNQKTIQQIIDTTSKATEGRKTDSQLGKDDFLNLLVTQLRYQDPLNPTDDKEFIGQMAQFSSLEQMQNMNTSISQSQGFTLIGKRVTASIVDENTKQTKAVEGDVTSVKVSKGKTYVVVKGEDVPIESITNVSEGLRGSELSNISAYTDLIGFEAKGSAYDSSTGSLVGVTGVVKSIQRGVYDDFAVMDGVYVDISEIVTDTPSTNPDFMSDYLRDNTGKEVTVMIIDRETGQKVPIKAILEDYSIGQDKKVKATLNQVNIPVESITNVKPHEQESNEEVLLEQILERI